MKSCSPGGSPRIGFVGAASAHVPLVQIVPLGGAVGFGASQPTRRGDVVSGGVGHLPPCSSPPGRVVVVGVGPSPGSGPTPAPSAILSLNVPGQAGGGGGEAREVDVAR